MEYEHGRFEPRLEVVQHPPRKWFMSGAHNSSHFSFTLTLRTRFLKRGLRGILPLQIILLYDNDYPVDDQSIVEFLEKPRFNLEDGEAVVKVRLHEASTWPQHGNKHFYFRISTTAMVAGEKVTKCCTKSFQVLSKSIENLKYELKQMGESIDTSMDLVREKYGVDIKGHVGNKVISSDMTIELTRSDRRKALLRARIDHHGEGYRKKKPLPSQKQQFRLFQMYNHFKQDRINYFKSRQPPKVEEEEFVSRKSLAYSLKQSKSSIDSLRSLLPKLSDDELLNAAAPSTKDNGLWKRNLPMYKRPAEFALAEFYVDDGRYNEANELLERCFKIQAAAMGDRHSVCASTLLLWARSNREQGLVQHAIKRERQALQIRYENYHTISNPLVMSALDDLCSSFARARDFTAAKQLCLTTLKRFVVDLGPDHGAIRGLQQRADKFSLRYERYA